MTFDETNVNRDKDGKFDNKVGSAPGISLPAEKLTKVRIPEDQAWKYKNLKGRTISMGEETPTMLENTQRNIYVDGRKVGALHSVTVTPSVRVSKGIRRDLKPRIEHVMVVNENDRTHGSYAVRYPSRSRAILSRLNEEEDL